MIAPNVKYTISIDGETEELDQVVEGFDDLDSQAKKAAHSLEELEKRGSSAMEKLKSGIGIAIGERLVRGIEAVPGILWQMAQRGLEFNASLEMGETKFETLLRSATAARDRMEELTKFAASTPFQLNELVQASTILQTLTKGVLATGDGLRLVGDAAATANVPVSELATHMGRLYAGLQGGTAVGESLARLQELGLISAEARQQIEQMQAAGQHGDAVWKVAAQELGQYTGQMEKLAGTFNGLLSTLSDNIDAALGKVMQDTFPQAKEQIMGIIDALGQPETQAKLQDMAKAVGSITKAFFTLGGWVASGANGLVNFIDDMAEVWDGVDATVTPVLESKRLADEQDWKLLQAQMANPDKVAAQQERLKDAEWTRLMADLERQAWAARKQYLDEQKAAAEQLATSPEELAAALQELHGEWVKTGSEIERQTQLIEDANTEYARRVELIERAADAAGKENALRAAEAVRDAKIAEANERIAKAKAAAAREDEKAARLRQSEQELRVELQIAELKARGQEALADQLERELTIRREIERVANATGRSEAEAETYVRRRQAALDAIAAQKATPTLTPTDTVERSMTQVDPGNLSLAERARRGLPSYVRTGAASVGMTPGWLDTAEEAYNARPVRNGGTPAAGAVQGAGTGAAQAVAQQVSHSGAELGKSIDLMGEAFLRVMEQLRQKTDNLEGRVNNGRN
jgi:hypothetical protein